MGSNRETRARIRGVHMFLALLREGTNKDHRCMRQVIRNYEEDIRFLEMRCLARGGEWRIHQTVNPRDTEKAMKFLMKKLIDHPELCTDIDMEWRTALLQPECIFGNKSFMLDVDTKDIDAVDKVKWTIVDSGGFITSEFPSPKGWHIVTTPFDTRRVCELPDVTLQRDGYFYVRTVGYSEPPR